MSTYRGLNLSFMHKKNKTEMIVVEKTSNAHVIFQGELDWFWHPDYDPQKKVIPITQWSKDVGRTIDSVTDYILNCDKLTLYSTHCYFNQFYDTKFQRLPLEILDVIYKYKISYELETLKSIDINWWSNYYVQKSSFNIGRLFFDRNHRVKFKITDTFYHPRERRYDSNLLKTIKEFINVITDNKFTNNKSILC